MMISQEQIKRLVNDSTSFYRACITNEYWMPAFNSPMCTVSFMLDIYNGLVFIPKLS